jgi:hypothetical protein
MINACQQIPCLGLLELISDKVCAYYTFHPYCWVKALLVRYKAASRLAYSPPRQACLRPACVSRLPRSTFSTYTNKHGLSDGDQAHMAITQECKHCPALRTVPLKAVLLRLKLCLSIVQEPSSGDGSENQYPRLWSVQEVSTRT